MILRTFDSNSLSGMPFTGLTSGSILLFFLFTFSFAAEAEEGDDERESADKGEDGFGLVEEGGAAEALPEQGEELRFGGVIRTAARCCRGEMRWKWGIECGGC